MKLSGVAVPSCCCGSSQREAMLVCQASTSLPFGTTVAAARVSRRNGIGSAMVANAALLINVRRVSTTLSHSSVGFLALVERSRFQLEVFPRIGVAGGEECREHVLPLRRLDPRPIRVEESMPEHRHEVIFLEDRLLDFLGELLAFGGVERGGVFGEFVVERPDA